MWRLVMVWQKKLYFGVGGQQQRQTAISAPVTFGACRLHCDLQVK
jgi:hypothetical protein